MSGTLVERFHAKFQSRTDAPAFRFLVEDGSAQLLTAGQTDTRVRAVAEALLEITPRGSRALILCPPGLHYITAFLGCVYSGVVAVPVYPPDGGALARMVPRLLGAIKDSSPSVAIVTASVMAQREQIVQLAPALARLPWLCVDDVPDHLAGQWNPPQARPDDVVFLQYTSGSTGQPKGVMLTHANLMANLSAIDECFFDPEIPAPHQVIWLPPYHDMGLIGGLLTPAFRGHEATLMSPLDFVKRPLRWLQAISDYGATHSGAPNFGYDLAVARITDEERTRLDLSEWRVAFSGAEPVRAATLDRFAEAFGDCGLRRSAFLPCYGMAEATLLITGCHFNAEPLVIDVDRDALQANRLVEATRAEDALALVGCGAPSRDHHVCIVDPHTAEVLPDGAIGEIWADGPSMSHGYWNRLEETAERLHAYTARGEGPFVRTGDLGVFHGGELFVTGRIKDLVIIAGRNHYPHDIEATVEAAHPALRAKSGIAFSVEHADAEKLVVVQTVRGGAAQRNGDEVCSAIRAAVAEEHGIEVYDILLVAPARIPKTSSGKLQRSACKQAYLADEIDVLARWTAGRVEPRASCETPSVARPELAAVPSALQQELESWMVDRLAERLDLPAERIDTGRALAGYGLQSVDLVGTIGDLERRLGRTLSPTLAWEYPTIEDLARYLATDDPHDAPAAAGHAGSNEPIAIVGIGCRLPGGVTGPEDFWQLLIHGIDGVGEVPASRWSADQAPVDDPNRTWLEGLRWGGFVDDIDEFDADFFGISPREAVQMDPQQRMLAEVAWEALEDAGLPADRLAGTDTGVFVGISTSDYSRTHLAGQESIDIFTGLGNAFSIAANRLSYLLDLHGPSMAIDTACSSSLVAIYQACASIGRGDCSAAIAGGVNLVLSPDLGVGFARAGAMAADGRCKAFDARADGYVRSEGAGVVVLKPLSAAQADGDRIYAVIRGGAVNQDGASNGLMSPSPQAQEAVLRRAYRDAGVDPNQVGYIEAHGTGTLLGEPIEMRALSAVVSECREPSAACFVGSVKTNLGHLEAAAGVAGLIKVALSLKHGRIPPSLHFEQPNPHIPFAAMGLAVPTVAVDWPAAASPLLAGVSAFGFGGTNVHLVLEESPVDEQPTESEPPPDEGLVLPLSAKNATALRQLAGRHAARLLSLRSHRDAARHCAASAVRRAHHDERIAVVGRDASELAAALTAFVRGEEHPGLVVPKTLVGRHPKIAFVFSGQGPRWWPLATDLLDVPVFREVLDQCQAGLGTDLGWSLIEQLTTEDSEVRRLDDPGVSQPVTCAVQIALAAVWRSWGIEPSAVVGHSLGELAAAHVGGALALRDAMQIARHRGEVIRAAIGLGKMAVVGASFDTTATLLGRYGTDAVSVGASNGPTTTVISGEREAVEQFAERLDEEGYFCRVLESVDYASHSPQMEPLKTQLTSRLNGLAAHPAAATIVSTVSGAIIDGDRLDAAYWAENLRRPVLFDAAIDTLLAQGVDTFVEVSPHPSLVNPVRDKIETAGTGVCTASLSRDEPGHQRLLAELGRLYTAGYPVEWAKVHPGPVPQIQLPTYPWQHQRYWPEPTRSPSREPHRMSPDDDPFWTAVGAGDSAALARILSLRDPQQRAALEALLPALMDWNTDKVHAASSADWLYRVVWRRKRPPVAQSLTGRWLLVAPTRIERAAELTEALSAAIAHQGGTTLTLEVNGDLDRAELSARLRLLADDEPVAGVVSLVAFDESPTAAHPSVPRCGADVLTMLQAMEDTGVVAPLWTLTSGAVSIGVHDPADHPLQAMAWGISRTAHLEEPALCGGLIDIDARLPETAAASQVVAILRGEDSEDETALRLDGSYVRRLVRDDRHRGGPEFAVSGTVLMTGGTGVVGARVARWLAQHGADHMILLSRRGERAPGVQQLANDLMTTGCRVTVAACDVSDREGLRRLLDGLDPAHPVRHVFHLAGDLSVLDSVGDTTQEQLASAVTAKCAGAWNLHELLGDTVDSFVLFSSMSGVGGSPHQAAYTGANAYLDALAEYRRRRNLPAQAIQWGAWAGESTDVFQRGLELTGMPMMEEVPALAAFAEVLRGQATNTVVADVDWRVFAPVYEDVPSRRLLREISVTRKTEGAESGDEPETCTTDLSLTMLAIEPGPRRQAALVEACREVVGRLLGREPSQIPVDAPMVSLGFDSLLSLELKNRLESLTGVSLPTTLAWRCPTIGALVPYLAERMGIQIHPEPVVEDDDPLPVQPPPFDPAPALDVDSLSDAAVEAELLARLAQIESPLS